MPAKVVLPKTDAFAALTRRFPGSFTLKGKSPIQLKARKDPGFMVNINGRETSIVYGTVSDLYRALGQLAALPSRSAKKSLTGKPAYGFRGLMIDMSRNGVTKPSYLKETVIPALALLGLNYLCLYTEDTYEIKKHPLIGYKRGRYSAKDLKSLSRYAKKFGITMFPCIQTLGHVEQILRIPKYMHLRDDNRIFSYKQKDTYRLISDMLDSARAPYDTDLIHIGLDETWGLAKGKTFVAGEKTDPRQVYLDHLQKVNALCKKKKLRPIMWGDIVIGMHNAAMTASQTKQLPKNIIMDFWNYYQKDPAFYGKTIRNYRKMGFEPLISPGLWNWNHLWADCRHAARTMDPFIKTGIRMGIDRVMMTMWGDDGQEAPLMSNVPGLVHYLDMVYDGKTSQAGMAAKIKSLFGDERDAFILPALMDEGNLAKGFLYDDPLLGKYSLHAGKKRYNKYFADFAKKLKAVHKKSAAPNRLLFQYACRLADCLSLKADLRNSCAAAYRKKDKRALRACCKTILEVISRVNALRMAHRELWMEERDIHGWEELEIRYGGLLARLDTAGNRIDRYLKGQLKTLAEFDEPDRKLFPSLQGFYTLYKNAAKVSCIG